MTKCLLFAGCVVFILGFLVPESRVIPVQGATPADWNPRSFWYYPWGRSITHKGIDIFATLGTPVRASSAGWVISSGENDVGGRYVRILAANWRIHYYAHLNTYNVHKGQWLEAGQQLGTVGNSGNAKNRPAHLHYSIFTLLPRWWQATPGSKQRWRKLFYIDPHVFLTESHKATGIFLQKQAI